ncbi:FAD:protein FMN transferase [Echinimonas agarilytica]|uniref:FAD:protein FMN transferase n=1 Tax=Echinimonas agarilytica TaxID=1215918 RepID=A0AA41W7X1_9GAMM|nr:FAD:protein FMN transferase [Echinimonas agarilytica]MCM2680570.1 FAD:protein FMN transferase [Echinimonas agarilytica]
MTKQQKVLWLALIGLAIFVFWWQQPEKLQQVEIDGQTMGTYYVVKVVAPESEVIDAVALKAKIDDELVSVNKAMSTYDPTSELSLFNQSESIDPQVVSTALAYVVDEAIRLGELSHGALDVTVGPLVNLWGFGPDGRPEKKPEPEQQEAAQARVGLKHLQLSAQGLSKTIPNLYVDLSTIAKGYGVDQVAELVMAQGFTNVMVDIGGELRLEGMNANRQAWRIAIEKPVDGERAVQQIVAASNMGIATSGDYRNYFEVDGVRFSHIIDPETSLPINHRLVSVTVLHPSSMTADGLSTALMVMGDKEGFEWAEALELPVYMIIKTDQGFEGKATAAMQAYLVH